MIIYKLKAAIAFTIILSSGLLAKDIEVKTQPKSVTVFLSGAEIERSARVNLPQGVHFVKFIGLSNAVNANSIQAGGKGNFTILSVTKKQNYFDAQQGSPEFKKLNDSLNLLKKDLELLQGIQQVYNQEKTMILQNQKVLGDKNAGSAVNEIKSMADFYRTRLTEITELSLKGNYKMQEINQKISRINNQLNQLRRENKYTSEIWVEVSSETNTTASLNVKYLVNNARWLPYYQIRVDGKTEEVEIVNNAQIFQTTGIDWKNIRLTLSTTNPQSNNSIPVLNPWRLHFVGPVNQDKLLYSNRATSMEGAELESVVVSEDAKAMTSSQWTVVSESQIDQRFEIKLPYDIPSDGQAHQVNVSTVNPNAEFEYKTIPKLRKETFLLCKIKEWEKYSLLTGRANVYFNGTYVGRTTLNASKTSENLKISIGVDKQIPVERRRLEDFCSTKLIGSNKRETIAIETSVKNTKMTTIEVIVEEQIPVASNNEISVELLEDSDAEYDEKTGKLTWKLELKPGESKSVSFKYEVKYPKDRRVNL